LHISPILLAENAVVMDTHPAALAIENNAILYIDDNDFSCFPEFQILTTSAAEIKRRMRPSISSILVPS
jgi:hypothetical protein